MAVIRSKPIAVLLTEDEKGGDSKIVAVPNLGIDPFYSKINSHNEIPEFTRSQIEHFFSHYKETEPNKFVRVKGWGTAAQSKKMIKEASEEYKKNQ
jgi:inorganic pyrophosphatase